jgi:predicted nucleic acid-binding protein
MRRVELSPEVARRAVDLRKQFRLRLPDAIVLASADREGCILVTQNAKDFDARDPRVRIPYVVERENGGGP